MISVIVPVYNVKKYLKKCVDSILSQTYSEFELILVDDGSKDGSGELCDDLQKLDDRIRVIHQENAGLSVARNTGTKAAKGDYIAYIDSDDWVMPNYLEELYQNLMEYQAQVSVCGYQVVGEYAEVITDDKNKEHVVSHYTGREATEQIVRYHKRFMITAWGKLYHKSVLDLLYYPDGRAHEDEFVTYKVFYESEKVAVSTKALYMYLQRDGSIMQSYSEKRLDALTALKETILYFEEKADADMRMYAIKRYVLNLQIVWYRVKKYLAERKDILVDLRCEWKKWFHENRKNIWKTATFVEKVSLCVFLFSPSAYSIMAGMYVRMFPDA